LLAFGVLLALLTLLPPASASLAEPLPALPQLQAAPLDVVVSEIAWMGTTASSSAEWLELYNNTTSPVNLSGWTLRATDGTPNISLSGVIPAGGYYLLERSLDTTLPGIVADQLYTGSLEDGGEYLELRDAASTLVDSLDASSGWFSGHLVARVPMVRLDPLAEGSLPANWTYSPRCGSPTNAAGQQFTCTPPVTQVDTDLDYAVYFNTRATTATGTTPERTELEEALLRVIDGATTSVDVALYGLDRQSVVQALIAAHQRGVTVRVVGDDDASQTAGYTAFYQALRDAGITIVLDASLADIQHNKFLVADQHVTWTGSTNLTDNCITLNANNSIIITSTVLATTYTAEFEEMWGGAFHRAKIDNTAHRFDFQGTQVESYFSPTDLVAFEVWDELGSATESLHFAMFYWTDEVLTQRVMERLTDNVAVLGIWDQLGAGNAASPDEQLCDAGATIAIENLPGLVHHKFAVLDVYGADPRVVLGSYNWTDNGAYDNDENTLIIHHRGLAEAYYAEWLRLMGAMEPERICNPPVLDAVTLGGPGTGATGQTHTFTAAVDALSITPITYTWEATGQSPIVVGGQGVTHTVAFAWPEAGTQAITVTAQSAWGQATAVHSIAITPAPALTVALTGPATGAPGVDYTFLAIAHTTATTPLTYTWQATGQMPIVQAERGLTTTVTFQWPDAGTKGITVTVMQGAASAVNTHSIVLAVDNPEYTVFLPLVARDHAPAPLVPDVRIVHIEHSPASNPLDEYVLLQNFSSVPQVLTGWTLRDLAGKTFIFPFFTLPIDGVVRVWTGKGTNTATDLYWGSGVAIWNNGGDTAYLRDAAGNSVAEYSY
jgi:hypothetical protein